MLIVVEIVMNVQNVASIGYVGGEHLGNSNGSAQRRVAGWGHQGNSNDGHWEIEKDSL